MKKQYAVFGLGSFGRSVALTLERMGGEVIVIDTSYERIQEIADSVSYAFRIDVTDPDALKSIGGRNLDAAVVAIGENLEAAIMATMACKEMGIPFVLAKVKDKLQAQILKKIGADAVISPEHDTGTRVAKGMMSAAFTDWIELSDEFSLVERPVPKTWAGKALTDLRVRERYGINVVGMIQGKRIQVELDPYEPLPEDGIIILVGANEKLEHLSRQE